MDGMDAHRIGEERSIAMHRAIAERLQRDPSVLHRAVARVERWLREGSVAAPYAEAWAEWLRLPVAELAQRLVDPGERARAMRQASPFAGALDPRERWRIRREVRVRLESA